MYAIPALHPANLFHSGRKWRAVMEHDVNRAIALARGWRPEWRDENYLLRPTLKQIRDYAKRCKSRVVGWDTETDGRHPLVCDVRCIGFWNGVEGLAIPFLWRDGSKMTVPTDKGTRMRTMRRWVPWFGENDLREALKWIQEIFDHAALLRTQNGQYDRTVMRSSFGVNAPQGQDTILDHHIVASFLPHSLAFLSSMFTDIAYYKTTEEGEAWSASSDLELWIYMLRDAKCTWLAGEKLDEEVCERTEDVKIREVDYWSERKAEEMRTTGIGVDLEALALLQSDYTAKRDKALLLMRDTLNALAIENQGAFDELLAVMKEPEFRPGSLPELRLALSALGVPLTALTETGEITTAEEFLLEARAELLEQRVAPTDSRIAFLDYLFAWRTNAKMLSTFLDPELLYLDEVCPQIPRIHPTFSVHIPPTGRYSSEGPNFQNQPKPIRGIYIARPGHELVAGDWDSGELRLAAYQSGEKTLIDAFDAFDAGKGPKIHRVNAKDIFNLPLEQITDAMYRAGKSFCYGIIYGSGPKTGYESCRPEMPDMPYSNFLKCYENFKRKRSQLFNWQADLLRLASRQGFIDSPILKRRRYFFEMALEDTPEAAAVLNMPCQSGLADVVSLANIRMDEVVMKYRKRLRSREVCAQLAQVHDELLFEVPTRLAREFARDFKATCEAPVDEAHRHWRMPVEVEIKRRWSALPHEKKEKAA